MTKYKDLNDLFEEHKSESPDKILEQIKAFFVSSGNDFQDGLISEEEFYLATNYGMPCVNYDSVYIKLCKMKNDIQVNWRSLSNNSEFKESYDEWKKTEQIQIQPWMKNSIIRKGDLKDSVEWVFSVLDACKIPTCEFDVLMSDYKGEFPEDLLWRYSSDSVSYVLAHHCTNIECLLRDLAPEGKHFSLNFECGITANIVISEVVKSDVERDRYICTGTITDYVEKPQRIDIYIEDNRNDAEVLFGYQKLSPLQMLMQTAVNPIPHPQWNAYEAIRFERLLRREAEYKILRLPFMLGRTDSNNSANIPHKTESSNKAKVISLYNKGKAGFYRQK